MLNIKKIIAAEGSELIFESKSEEETESVGYEIAATKLIQAGSVVALCGELGAGKTAFTRGAARFIAPHSRVTSPTFALVNEYYISADSKLFHFDMYRINTEEDLLSIGFFDFLSPKNIILIEWYENIQVFFDEITAKIEIEKVESENTDLRRIKYRRQ